MGPRQTHDVPRTLHYCRICRKETTHEIRKAGSIETTSCVACRDRSVSYELDRE